MITLKDHRRAAAYCAACPKLCRHACPVSNATGNEVHTPWGKMLALEQHLSGKRGFDESSGAAVYACTGCGRCRIACKHSNDVAQALFDARAEVVDEGEAPQPIDRVRDRFARHGNPHGADLAAAVEQLARGLEGRPYFPGCTALARESGMATAALDAAADFGVRLALAPVSARCCGYPLWAAGLRDAFVEHARHFAAACRDLPELVVGDPGCAWTLARAYPAVGVELRPRMVLLVDLLAERIELAFGRAPLPLPVAWHDGCHLGRHFGRYDGPRRLVRAAAGEIVEAAESREEAGCCGGGGLLALTHPEVSRAIARAEAAALGSPARTIVSACPVACRQFRRAGAEVIDLYTLLARWIAAREEDEPRSSQGPPAAPR